MVGRNSEDASNEYKENKNRAFGLTVLKILPLIAMHSDSERAPTSVNATLFDFLVTTTPEGRLAAALRTASPSAEPSQE